MNIAVLEDLELDQKTLRDILTAWSQEQRTACDLRWFRSGEEFLEDFAPEQYDLLFLDLLLGEGMTGMDAARAVRSAGSHAAIVFTTSERDYAVEGYEVQAIDYLIKPYDPRRIRAILTRVLSSLRTRRYLTVSVGRGTQCICTDDLLWAEARDHYVDLHLAENQTVRISRRFEEVLEALSPQPQFSCCCRGVVVNLAFVDTLQGTEFLLRDGQRVPVSRSKRTAMQRALSDYAIAKTREEMGL